MLKIFFSRFLFLQNHGHKTLIERETSVEILLLPKIISVFVKYILSSMYKVAETHSNIRCAQSRETAEFGRCVNSWS